MIFLTTYKMKDQRIDRFCPWYVFCLELIGSFEQIYFLESASSLTFLFPNGIVRTSSGIRFDSLKYFLSISRMPSIFYLCYYSASQNPTFFSKVFIIMICIISFIKDRELICHATIKCGKNRPNHFNFLLLNLDGQKN